MKLEKRGLGDARHRRDLREQISECKTGLAECVFLLSHLDSFDPIPVLESLKKTEKDASGGLASSDAIFVFSIINYLSIELKEDYDSLSEIPLLEKGWCRNYLTSLFYARITFLFFVLNGDI